MIYITGDTHGGFRRFGNKYFPPQKHMSREDYVIITGDFGGLWDGGPKDWYWLDWLSGKPFTTLFVDGNHENFDLLNALPEKEWHGGRVHEVRENILHLMRGQRFTIGGCSVFAMGGAASHDIRDGILEKDDPSSYDFRLGERQRELLKALEEPLPVNFLTDNDITGGNSGSPVLNAEGKLIGLAFDGNKESLASDASYTPGYNRCVCVDIRSILWTLDEYAGMDRILDEIGVNP